MRIEKRIPIGITTVVICLLLVSCSPGKPLDISDQGAPTTIMPVDPSQPNQSEPTVDEYGPTSQAERVTVVNTATAFMTVLLRPDIGQETWSTAMHPYLLPVIADKVASTDITIVPAGEVVAGGVAILEVTPGGITIVSADTTAGEFKLAMDNQATGEWLIVSITWPPTQ